MTVGRGHEHYENKQWQAACDAFVEADRESPLELEDLELLAWSAGLAGRDELFIASLERLHDAAVADVRCGDAARYAFWIAMRLFALGEPARAGGWLGRSSRLVERAGECVERGWLMLPMTLQQLNANEYELAGETAARAAAIGEQFGDRDLVAFARHQEGRAAIRRGELDAGLSLIDEAMVDVLGGKLSPLVTGLVYCSAIASCQQVFAVDRAREWTDALGRWWSEQPELVAFTARCMVHRSEVMELGGEWADALAEAERAIERSDNDPDDRSAACYQKAELHRLRGELDAAEELYTAAARLGREVQPGLALLRVAQGRAGDGLDAIRRVLETTAARWKRARFLPAAVDIALAAGDVDGARASAAELAEIAGAIDSDILEALAAQAGAAVELAGGRAAGAVAPLRRALSVWQRVGAPYITATIHAQLGDAFEALGDGDGARLERAAAAEIFAELGIQRSATAAEPAGAAAPAGLSPRELEVLRVLASGATNKEIAAALGISERTVDRHVSNIYNKIDVSTRAAATAFAYENGLVG